MVFKRGATPKTHWFWSTFISQQVNLKMKIKKILALVFSQISRFHKRGRELWDKLFFFLGLTSEGVGPNEWRSCWRMTDPKILLSSHRSSCTQVMPTLLGRGTNYLSNGSHTITTTVFSILFVFNPGLEPGRQKTNLLLLCNYSLTVKTEWSTFVFSLSI